ncbi:MAG: hypothetical protein ABSF98_06905 [Bryobacteraceae bacterium]|jgi:hypothetical protein
MMCTKCGKEIPKGDLSCAYCDDSRRADGHDEIIDQLFRNTHHACRTLRLPGVANIFQEGASLPLEAFMAEYRTGAVRAALRIFCDLSPRISEKEFLIALYYSEGLLRYLLTSHTLVLLDQALWPYHILNLRDYVGVKQSGGREFTAFRADGSQTEITLSFQPDKDILDSIDCTCRWASGHAKDPALQTADYDPKLASTALKWHCARRGALFGTSIFGLFALRAAVGVFLGESYANRPGEMFAGLAAAWFFLTLGGFGAGYLYGFFKQRNYNR